jgi:hypothetical protein
MTVERFLLGLRDLERQGQLPTVLSAPVEMTPHRTVSLLLKRTEERTEEETQALLRVDQIHPDVARTRLLMQQFRSYCANDTAMSWISGWRRLSTAEFPNGAPSCENCVKTMPRFRLA